MSWFASRNWCLRIGGHLLDKSDVQRSIPDHSVTSHKFYWIGLRQIDWTLYNTSSMCNDLKNKIIIKTILFKSDSDFTHER